MFGEFVASSAVLSWFFLMSLIDLRCSSRSRFMIVLVRSRLGGGANLRPAGVTPFATSASPAVAQLSVAHCWVELIQGFDGWAGGS